MEDVTMPAYEEDRVPHDADDEALAPTLSVTVLNYNYATYLPQCLDSILKQTWKDFELIIINDCSTDNSLEVIEPYQADPRVHLVNHTKNQGYIKSLIEGSEMSRGKYITVISADDFCVSDHAFESLIHMMESDAEVAWAYSTHGVYGADGVRSGVSQHHATALVRPGYEEYRDLLLRGYDILHSGVIIRSSAYKAVGGYDPSARYACDSIMWLMLCAQGKVAYCTDELFGYRRHGTNMSFTREGVEATLREHAYGIRKSFAVMKGAPGVTKGAYRRAMRKALSYRAIEYMLAGRVQTAWFAFWCGVRVSPMLTIFQAKTLSLVGRTLLGPSGFQVVRAAVRREHRSAPAPA
jgi:glycosyltransferase involved in cell wall biosynthesis